MLLKSNKPINSFLKFSSYQVFVLDGSTNDVKHLKSLYDGVVHMYKQTLIEKYNKCVWVRLLQCANIKANQREHFPWIFSARRMQQRVGWLAD